MGDDLMGTVTNPIGEKDYLIKMMPESICKMRSEQVSEVIKNIF